MTDDLFTPTTPPNLGAPKPRCRRHDWRHGETLDPWEAVMVPVVTCFRCGAVRDEARAARGRRNRARGLRIQRDRNRALGVTNIAGNAPNHDGGTHRDMFVTESKSGSGAFSERYWRWLRGIPAEAGQVRLLVVTEAPGPGRRARSYVVVDFDDWRDLHGDGR